MHPRFTTRRPSATRTWRVLAVVFALWFNLAVQPCAMAMGADGDCPHCPPPAAHDMAMAHDHHDMGVDTDCATFDSDCDDVDDFGIDSRGSNPKVKDNTEVAALVPAIFREPFVRSTGTARPGTDPPEADIAPAPLHLLNCVFLD